jgi:hypothetical protein
MKTVFIVSSDDARERVAEPIAQSLAAANFTPIRWWSSSTFPPGSHIFEQLCNLAASVDAAVIVATGEDKTWFRGKEVLEPRDNVMLEAGLFASRVGPTRCLIVADKDPKLPSDLSGIVYIKLLENDLDGTGARIAEALKQAFKKDNVAQRADAFCLLCDPNVTARETGSSDRRDWLCRNMYFGLDGAQAWLGLANDSGYNELNAIRPAMSQLVRDGQQTFASYISLGTGDGVADQYVINALRRSNPGVKYVPVDISDGLLFTAYAHMNARANIPIAILGDYEDGLPFVITNALRNGGHRALIGMLGNSFGNLDRDENLFFDDLIGRIEDEDCILVEAAGFKEGDMTINIDPKKWGPAKKRFFALGIARKLGVTHETALKRFNTFIFHDVEDGYIFGSKKIRIMARTNGTAEPVPVAFVRRYSMANLQEWFEDRGMKVTSKRVVLPEVDSCLFMLRRK